MYDSIVEWMSEDEARALYTTGDAAHDFDHVRRVTHLARAIARAEGAHEAVVCTAALLHDVPAHFPEGDAANARAEHHMAAASFAQEYLTARGVPAAHVANVVHCIEAHRFRDASRMPATLEAQCLYDADKLDSMGAIGVARAFAFAGTHGNRLWHMDVAAIEARSDTAARPRLHARTRICLQAEAPARHAANAHGPAAGAGASRTPGRLLCGP